MVLTRLTACAGLALLVSACGNAQSAAAPQPPREAPPLVAAANDAAPAAPSSSSAGVAPVTAEGLDPVRIGMTEAEALRALGTGWQADRGSGDPQSCHYLSRGEDGAEFTAYMVENGRVTNVTIQNDAPTSGRVTVVTDRGVGLGSTEAQVRAAYPDAVVEPHQYADRPASYVTAWVRGAPSTPGGQPAPDARGVQFVTNQAAS